MKTRSLENLSSFCVGKESSVNEAFKLRLFIPVGKNRNGEDVVFGPGIHRLLHEVKDCGTIVKASESMKMAYSKCWKIIRNTEDALGIKLLNRNVGRGNGSSITPEGEDILSRYDAFLDEVTSAASVSYKKYFE